MRFGPPVASASLRPALAPGWPRKAMPFRLFIFQQRPSRTSPSHILDLGLIGHLLMTLYPIPLAWESFQGWWPAHHRASISVTIRQGCRRPFGGGGGSLEFSSQSFDLRFRRAGRACFQPRFPKRLLGIGSAGIGIPASAFALPLVARGPLRSSWGPTTSDAE